MSLKKVLMLSSVTVFATGLVACSHKAPTPVNKQVVKKKPLTQTQRWQHQLAKQNVQLIKQGWRMTVIMPVDRLFEAGTTELKPSAYPLLKRVSTIIDTYSHETNRPYPVHVWGFADNVFNLDGQTALSHQYAQSVASFLWSKGFSHHELQIVGKGIHSPVAPQNTVLGRSFNRRVVIQVH